MQAGPATPRSCRESGGELGRRRRQPWRLRTNENRSEPFVPEPDSAADRRRRRSPGADAMPTKQLRIAPALLALAAVLPAGCGKMGLPPAGPPDVEVVEVIQKDVPITKEWVATLNGLVNAQIRAQVTGILLKQEYTNGAVVKKGSPLFLIDPRPFQATLDQATANLQQAKASLDKAKAQLGKTQLDVDRYTPLAKESAISQQELDDAVQAN